MASNLNRAVLTALVLALYGATAQASYLDQMASLDAKIQLVNKQNELNTALKTGSQTVFLPTVRSIVIDDHGPSAQVVFKSGVSRWVKPGDTLANGVKVGAISSNSVTAVTGKGAHAPLDFYAENATSTGTELGMNEPNVSMPPVPTRMVAQPVMPGTMPGAAPVQQGVAPAPGLPVAPVPGR